MINRTLAKEFLLLGFGGHQNIRALLFTLFFFVYVIIIFGNLLIIGLVGTNQSLHSPMYVFLSNLSFSEIMITTNIVPNMLAVILEGSKTISFSGCLTQLFFHGLFGYMECLYLTVMSYDRYLAVCNPLQYISIMDVMLKRYIVLVWISSFILVIVPLILLLQLYFCDSNVIDFFFCDLTPLLALSCSDTFKVKTEAIVSSVLVALCLFLIVSSYVCILLTIFRIPSALGRQKTFSTCSSHLLAVFFFFLTIISVYGNPTKVYSSTISKLQSLLYVLGTPFFNPIIYTLRNKEIKSVLHKLKNSLKNRNH
ncbi:olfactory receptor 5AS1-like [Aquarana catesbeiana]|uniref:olfactory receptor 5AS1-like n=1 Tax=Aquarana catesbeiana TaxID=8400 RepID=UPI003CCA3E33